MTPDKSKCDRHAEAFRELEPKIGDLWRMAIITQMIVARAADPPEGRGLPIFVTGQLLELATALKDEYYRLYEAQAGAEIGTTPRLAST